MDAAARLAKGQVDSILQMERRFYVMRDSAQDVLGIPSSWFQFSPLYVESISDAPRSRSERAREQRAAAGGEWVSPFGFATFLALLAWIITSTREGVQRFNRREYDSVRNEIVLYHRTESLLERLQYHMSFGEGTETSVRGGPLRLPGIPGIEVSAGRSRGLTRAMRPFTVFSIVEEYRRFAREVSFYLNEALRADEGASGASGGGAPGSGESAARPEQPAKVVIAIDELDKVLDSQRLHAMLKTMKAVFDIEGVHYLFSISEDALQSYRLRHMEAKNEVDSAFTYVFNLPPMSARASLALLRSEPACLGRLLGAAIVLGGGVPRELHRIGRLLRIQPPWQSVDAYLTALYDEEVGAVREIIRHDACISDSWRERLVGDLPHSWSTTVAAVDARLAELSGISLPEFSSESPCAAEPARTAFYRTRSLLYALAVRSLVYTRVAALPVPDALLLSADDGRDLLKEVPADVEEWLAALDPLRQAAYDLDADPLTVWEVLKESACAPACSAAGSPSSISS
jgi:hypothetical protein